MFNTLDEFSATTIIALFVQGNIGKFALFLSNAHASLFHCFHRRSINFVHANSDFSLVDSLHDSF